MPDISVDQEQKKLIVVVEGIERLWIHNSRFEYPSRSRKRCLNQPGGGKQPALPTSGTR